MQVTGADWGALMRVCAWVGAWDPSPVLSCFTTPAMSCPSSALGIRVWVAPLRTTPTRWGMAYLKGIYISPPSPWDVGWGITSADRSQQLGQRAFTRIVSSMRTREQSHITRCRWRFPITDVPRTVHGPSVGAEKSAVAGKTANA